MVEKVGVGKGWIMPGGWPLGSSRKHVGAGVDVDAGRGRLRRPGRGGMLGQDESKDEKIRTDGIFP